ncbi:MAG TPA: sulfotransferase [Candidatus Limnocylindrales bacterium]
MTYTYIASTAYSGSTLLATLLAAHPAVATVGGVSSTRRQGHMATFQCSCGRLIGECPFWLKVAHGMRQRGYDDFRLDDFGVGFDSEAGRAGRLLVGSLGFGPLENLRDAVAGAWPAHRQRMRAIARRSEAIANLVLELTGATVFVDTSKERMRARYLLRELDVDLRVIHLVRDPRGVVDSVLRRDRADGDAAAAARRWARTHGAILRALDHLPYDRRLLVRYEDLCANPRAELDRIDRFLGLDPTLVGKPTVPGPGGQHILGNKRRLAGIGEIRLDERWRLNLDGAQLAAIVAATTPVMRRLFSGASQ